MLLKWCYIDGATRVGDSEVDMKIAEMAPWTVGWNRDTAHLFEDAATVVALCGNAVPRVNGRRLLVDPSLITYVYLNEKTFCHTCAKMTRRRLGQRVDDFGLHYDDAYGWSDDPKDIAILTGRVDSRRAQDHHYHPVFDSQPGYVQVFHTPTGVQHAWTFYARSPILYLATEIVPFDTEGDVKWRETLKAARTAGLGNSFSGHPLKSISPSDLARLENAMASQMDATLWLSSAMPTSQTKSGPNERNGN